MGLSATWTNFEFLKPSLKYLSCKADKDGLNMTDDAIAAVQKAERNTCPEQMHSFYELSESYRQFVPNTSTITSPLTNLLKKYRTTPHCTTGVTPAELMGRKLRTRRSIVHPDMTGNMEKRCTEDTRRERH